MAVPAAKKDHLQDRQVLRAAVQPGVHVRRGAPVFRARRRRVPPRRPGHAQDHLARGPDPRARSVLPGGRAARPQPERCQDVRALQKGRGELGLDRQRRHAIRARGVHPDLPRRPQLPDGRSHAPGRGRPRGDAHPHQPRLLPEGHRGRPGRRARDGRAQRPARPRARLLPRGPGRPGHDRGQAAGRGDRPRRGAAAPAGRPGAVRAGRAAAAGRRRAGCGRSGSRRQRRGRRRHGRRRGGCGRWRRRS